MMSNLGIVSSSGMMTDCSVVFDGHVPDASGPSAHALFKVDVVDDFPVFPFDSTEH